MSNKLFLCSVCGPMPTFHPEYGRFQIESTPGAPFNLTWKDLLSVEKDMKRRCVVFAFR